MGAIMNTEIKVGDLIRSKIIDYKDEVCLVLAVLNNRLLTVQRSRKRSYETSKITHINPTFYEIIL